MKPLTELSTLFSITNTAYNYASPTYQVTAPATEWWIITEISMGMNTNFINNGTVQMALAGNNITNEDTPSNEITFIDNFTFNFGNSNTFIGIEPNQDIVVNAKVSTGTGMLQVSVIGMRCTQYEYEAIRKRILGL